VPEAKAPFRDPPRETCAPRASPPADRAPELDQKYEGVQVDVYLYALYPPEVRMR
jgi:hypothetical protein